MTATEAPSDGRHLRRDRNRRAVVTALLELYREGNLAPSTEQIATRAGLSPRSLFRYFDDVDTLVRAAVEEQQRHLAPLFALDAAPDAPLARRVDALVDARGRLLEAMGPVGRVARSLAVTQPAIATELRRVRRALCEQVAGLFRPELDRLGADDARTLLAALDAALSWEAYHLHREQHGLTAEGARAATALTVRRLLGAR